MRWWMIRVKRCAWETKEAKARTIFWVRERKREKRRIGNLLDDKANINEARNVYGHVLSLHFQINRITWAPTHSLAFFFPPAQVEKLFIFFVSTEFAVTFPQLTSRVSCFCRGRRHSHCFTITIPFWLVNVVVSFFFWKKERKLNLRAPYAGIAIFTRLTI